MAVQGSGKTTNFLKLWLNENSKLWVFDISSQKIEEKTSDDFAIHDLLYIPKVSRQKESSVEKWFSLIDNSLHLFIQRIEQQDLRGAMSVTSGAGVAAGLVAMAYRSKYEIDIMVEYLGINRQAWNAAGISKENSDNLYALVAEYLLNQLVIASRRYSHGSICHATNPNGNLLLCDRPGEETCSQTTGTLQIPLSPQTFATMEYNLLNKKDFELSFAPDELDGTTVDRINSCILDKARNWVVASTKKQLEEVADQLTTEKVKARRSLDVAQYHVVALTENEKTAGWILGS